MVVNKAAPFKIGSLLEVLEVKILVEWKLNIFPGSQQKITSLEQQKPAPSYVKGVLRRFENCAIQAELL